ncbi:helix-turn-helix domain-containing protein [Geobacter sp. 60473]|uniref:helix-turn-helix domain-containing protein n=1 Tax=Geobacter sp. 60473 TaxID=3080755 RepID=UPI002B31A1B4|nr:helix-turn-helix transcriptional regulator [Geobacter sp. 60473]
MDETTKAEKRKRGEVVIATVFVERVEILMKQKKLSRAELADRADLSRSALTQFFGGERKPSADAVVKLANVLDTSTDYLLGRRDQAELADLLQSDKIKELLHLFSNLSTADQDRVLAMIRLMKGTARSPSEESPTNPPAA